MSEVTVKFTQAEFGFVKQSILDQAQALVDMMNIYASDAPTLKDIQPAADKEFEQQYSIKIDSEFMDQLNKKPNKKAPYDYKVDGTPKKKPGRKV